MGSYNEGAIYFFIVVYPLKMGKTPIFVVGFKVNDLKIYFWLRREHVL